MGGAKQSNYDRQVEGYNIGYTDYNPGESFSEYSNYIGTSNSNLAQGRLKGWQAAAAEAARGAGGGGFEMPDFSSMFEPVDYTSVLAQQKADAEKEAGIAQVRDLYSRKFDAAEKATAEVNQQIADEMGHAKVVGLDYTVDDATKQKRINDVFASYWGEGDDSTLTGLIGQWGDAGYTWDLPIKRGEAKKPTEKTEGAKAGEKVKQKGPKALTAEDPLATASVLG